MYEALFPALAPACDFIGSIRSPSSARVIFQQSAKLACDKISQAIYTAHIYPPPTMVSCDTLRCFSPGKHFEAKRNSRSSLSSALSLLFCFAQGICNSSNPEPVQQHPQASGHANGHSAAKQQQVTGQQQNGAASNGADEETRRRQRAAAAESRALKAANRGKSTTGRSSNGNRTTEDSILYPGLEVPAGEGAGADGTPSPMGKVKREKSDWEKQNAGALGSTTFNTHE
jgi:hypothetical protein